LHDDPRCKKICYNYQIKITIVKGDARWRCTVCGYEYDEAKEGTPFEKLPDDWTCPVCNAPKSEFEKVR
jgi:rubredoxin